MDRLLETSRSRCIVARDRRRRAAATRFRRPHEVLLSAPSPKPASRLLLLPLLFACLFAAACARNQKVKAPDIDLMRTSLESWHRYIRWGDFRSAQKFIAPERRFEFLKAVLENKDDENLKINEYELEDAQLVGSTAMALSKVTWHRLPSVTAKTDVVVTHWEYREGVWFIVGIENGPLPMEKKEGPKPEPPATPSPPDART